jgi:hypothetical protein
VEICLPLLRRQNEGAGARDLPSQSSRCCRSIDLNHCRLSRKRRNDLSSASGDMLRGRWGYIPRQTAQSFFRLPPSLCLLPRARLSSLCAHQRLLTRYARFVCFPRTWFHAALRFARAQNAAYREQPNKYFFVPSKSRKFFASNQTRRRTWVSKTVVQRAANHQNPKLTVDYQSYQLYKPLKQLLVGSRRDTSAQYEGPCFLFTSCSGFSQVKLCKVWSNM